MLPNALKIVVAGVAFFVVGADAADEKMREKMVLLPNADAMGRPAADQLSACCR
jgi:hypothetical protein